MQQSPSLGELTQAEQAMVEAVLRGEIANVRRQVVRGSVLRALILESRSEWQVPPVGVRIERAIIDGGLDLEGVALAKPIIVWHSRIQGGSQDGTLVLRDARLKRLGLHSCTLEGTVLADRVEVEGGLFLGGGVIRGSLLIRGADVTGALSLEGTEIGDGKCAVAAAGLTLSGPLILRRAKASGEITVSRARLGAGIYAEDAEISHAGTAFSANSVQCSGDILMDRARVSGGIDLANARIDGRLSADGLQAAGIPDGLVATGIAVAQGVGLERARISGTVRLEGADIGKALRAEGLEVDGGDVAIAAGVIRIGGNCDMPRVRLVGTVNLAGARIEGQLRLTGGRLDGGAADGGGRGPIAIRGDGATIRGGAFLSRTSITGSVRFPAAEFGNQFRLREASLKVDQGAALLLSGATFARDVELNGGLRSAGGLVLDQVVIRGTCDLRDSQLKSAALARSGARPAMQHNHEDDSTQRVDERVLSFVDAEIDRLQMPEKTGDRPRGIVDLTRAHIGSYDDAEPAWPPPPEGRSRSADGRDIDHLVMDGLRYEHLTYPGGRRHAAGKHHVDNQGVAESRMAWLDGQEADSVSHRFKPQAWVTLARQLAAQGYDDDARAITIARLRRERASVATSFGLRLQGRILDLFALYGFNPWRTVAWMIGFILVFAGVWAWAASHCAPQTCFETERVFVISHRDGYTPERLAERYPAFNPLAYSFDVFVPFVSVGYEDHWRPNLNFMPLADIPVPHLAGLAGLQEPREPVIWTVTVGGLLYLLTIVEMLIGLVLTSLAVTGFTGLLRYGEGR